MSEVKNVYTLCETVVDIEGNKHKVYPTPWGYIQEVAQVLSKVNMDLPFTSFMNADMEIEDGVPVVKRLDNGCISYGEEMKDEILSVIEIGLRFKETKDEIKKWLDTGLAQQIIEIMIGISQVKKQKEQMANQTTIV